MEDKKKGYITTTYQLRLEEKYPDWLLQTKQLYNRVAEHYLTILMNQPVRLELSGYLLMRELEILSVGTKEMKQQNQLPLFPLPDVPAVPLYFRRAAINYAIGVGRSFFTRYAEWEKHPVSLPPGMKGKLDAPPVYYKGMYRNLKKNKIELKLFTGTKWVWVEYQFRGRRIPEHGICLSPSLMVSNQGAKLLLPVMKPVAKLSVQEEKVLAVVFPGKEILAVGAVCSREKKFLTAYFVPGGRELDARRTRLQRKLKSCQRKYQSILPIQKEGDDAILLKQNPTVKEQRILQKIQNLNEYYAHKISRQIVDFCISQEIDRIVVPEFAAEKTAVSIGMLREIKSFRQKKFNYGWLGRRIVRYLKYKAFAEGILVEELKGNKSLELCATCGAKIVRFQEGQKRNQSSQEGTLFQCENNHKGNFGLNMAKNLGMYFWSCYENSHPPRNVSV